MDATLIKRLNSSVEFLKDGMTFTVGGFVLGMVNASTIFVNGNSSFMYPQNVTKEKALNELAQIKEEFNALKNESEEFSNYIKNKIIEYTLVIDTGNAGLKICSEKNGVVEFFI